MVLGVDAQAILNYLGHDDPIGFHPQELTDYALLVHGIGFVRYDLESILLDRKCSCDHGCQYCDQSGIVTRSPPVPTFPFRLFSGVIMTETHAAAWFADEGLVYDPNFTVGDLRGYAPQTFFAKVDNVRVGR